MRAVMYVTALVAHFDVGVMAFSVCDPSQGVDEGHGLVIVLKFVGSVNLGSTFVQ